MPIIPQKKPAKNLKFQILHGLSWSGSAQIIRQLVQFITTVILARILNPHDFGLVSMVTVFSGFGTLFGDFGLGSALIQRKEITKEQINSVFWFNIFMGVFLTSLFIGCAPIISKFYHQPQLMLITVVISFIFIINSFSIVQKALLQKNMQFKIIALCDIFSIGIASIFGISMAYKSYGVWSLVSFYLLQILFNAILIWFLAKWKPGFNFNFRALRDLFSFSMNLIGFNAINYWSRNLDSLLIGKFLGTNQVGFYARAYNLMMLPMTQVLVFLTQVMFPVLSSIQDDKNRAKAVYLNATRMIALFTFPLMIGLFVVSEPFILAIYGEKWHPVVPILRLLCLVGMLQSVGSTVGWIYNSQARTDIQLKWGIINAIILFISFIIGLRWGVLGVAGAYAIANYGILWVPSWIIPLKLLNIRFFEMLNNLKGIFFCSIIMGALIKVISYIIPSNWPAWLTLIMCTVFGCAIYGSLLLLFKTQALQEVLLIISDVRNKKR